MGNVLDLTGGMYRRLWTDRVRLGRRINRVSPEAEMWFWRLHTICDDLGTFPSDPGVCLYAAAPMRRDVTPEQVAKWLNELASVEGGKTMGLIVLYECEGKEWGSIRDFEDLQARGRNGKRVKRFPGPEEASRAIKAMAKQLADARAATPPIVAETPIPATQPVLTLEEPPKAEEPRKRQPDAIWDAVAAEWFGGTVAKPDTKRVGKVVSALKEHKATLEQFIERTARYRQQWPDAECTPEAVVKHWVRMGEAGKPAAPSKGYGGAVADAGETVEEREERREFAFAQHAFSKLPEAERRRRIALHGASPVRAVKAFANESSRA